MNETEPTINHFGVLVDYLAEYPDDQLEQLAELYDAPAAEADAIARQWCQHPEAFLETIDEVFWMDSVWEPLEELVYEHDAPMETDWMGMSTKTQLVEVGLLSSYVKSAFHDEPTVLPGAIAALLAPRMTETRPSLAILLGKQEESKLRRLADRYDLSDSGSRIEVILRLMDFFAQPQTLEMMIQRVPNPDWIGMAMMVLELGGVCFWREVFGYDHDEEEPEESNVVPLMRQEERHEEQRVAETLVDLGFVFRFEVPDSPHDMVAVPEELWGPLWGMGRGWLSDWVRQSYYDLSDRAVGREVDQPSANLQEVGKWLVCEAASGRLTLDDGLPDSEEMERLEAMGQGARVDFEPCFRNLFDLSILRRGLDGFVTLGAEYRKLLDMPEQRFARNVLYEWCGGFVGRAFEQQLPKAVGLDEEWREQAMEILQARHEFIPHWMSFEGVPQERTGAGCLRETTDNTPQLLSEELGLANGYVWSAKMIWLDLLSLLEDERWYPFDGIVNLMQMCASVCLFSQVGRLIDQPRAYFYLPVQRTSFLTDPFHTSAFEQWIDDVVDGLLVPLGVAQRDTDEERVRLQTGSLSVDSPPGWSDRERRALLEDILGPDFGELDLREGRSSGLHAVQQPPAADENEVPLELEIDDILKAARGREVASFDGEVLRLAPASS